MRSRGFEATSYILRTDQLGTQLDPPAHWAPEYPGIDELPATYTIRPLVVIPIEDKVAKDLGYHLQVSDINEFEAKHGTIPEGSVVFVRSGWSKEWPSPELAKKHPFPGVGLDALKFLQLERKILFHGHEPLDTDATPTLEGEYWLMHNGYAQAEGVANAWLPWGIRNSRAVSAAMRATWRYARPTGSTGSPSARSLNRLCQNPTSPFTGTKQPVRESADRSPSRAPAQSSAVRHGALFLTCPRAVLGRACGRLRRDMRRIA
jgi:kynurenine formamidase